MGYDDYIEFALDVAEQANILLAFPDKVGAQARFGYHHGRWTLVTSGTNDYSATNVDRDVIFDALAENLNDVELRHPQNDRAWQWFIQKPTDGDVAMIESHCMCGAFRCSSSLNRVERWRRSHDQECNIGSKPSIIYPEDR